MTRRFQIYRNSDRNIVVADFTITGEVTGSEQNIVILDKDLKAVAIIELQPGFDREEVALLE